MMIQNETFTLVLGTYIYSDRFGAGPRPEPEEGTKPEPEHLIFWFPWKHGLKIEALTIKFVI